jgi:hypothetical protein
MKTAISSSAAAFSVLLVGIVLLANEVDAAKKIVVRPLTFAPKDPTVNFRIGGQNKLTVLADAAAVEKLVGKDNAKTLTAGVDFDKEMIVLVSWTTAGPPEGKLKYAVAGNDKEVRLTFYVQGPPADQPRGQRARIGADFFAIPRNVAVTFDAKERN